MAKAVGRPVRVQWSRADEHGWDPKGPPTLIDLRAAVDDAGGIKAWQSEFFIPQQTAGGFNMPLIAAALGWQIERIEETREPIIARVRRETTTVVVEPGQVAGCSHTAVAYREGRPVISLIHPQQVQPQAEGMATEDVIEIVGSPSVRLAGSPEIPGGQATAALAVNMIPRVLSAPPGLHTMPDLPVPAALMGDARHRLHDTGQAGQHG